MDMEQYAEKPFTIYVDSGFSPGAISRSSSPKPTPTPDDFEYAIKSGDRKLIKKYLRTQRWSADDKARVDLWYRICSTVEKIENGIYYEMVDTVFGKGKQSISVSLPSFVDPANMCHYHLSEQGIHIAKRVVCVIGNTNADITFAPSIFPIVCLLLHYMDEEQCYNCMYALLKSSNSYLIQTKVRHETAKYVLKDLTKKYANNCFKYILKQGLAVETVLENWLNWVLCDLPFQHVVHIVDCYLYEGPKVLYRIALAILILFYKEVASKGSGLDINASIKQFCEDMTISVDKLLKTAFGIRGLSRKEVRKSCVVSEMYVQSIRHVASIPHMTKSTSCESLNLKVSRSFSMTSGPLSLSSHNILQHSMYSSDELDVVRSQRSVSFGEIPFSGIKSMIVNFHDWPSIWSWLPARIALKQPVLLYTTAEHGTSLNMFYSRVDNHEPTVIFVKSDRNEVSGAYCSSDWTERKALKRFGYFGSGETFLFKLYPHRHRYEWVGTKLKDDTPYNANLFMAGDSRKLSIGGGTGEGLQLDEELLKGRSENCTTFNNDPLFTGGDFRCVTVEVFGFR